MKRVIVGSQDIFAMSIINPRMCKQLSIQVEVEQRDEGPIPHLHVYLDKTRNPKNCAYVRLDRAEYAPHHDSTPLSRSQKREFLNLMNTVVPKAYTLSVVTGEERHATGYQNAVETWIETFGDTVQFNYDDEGFLIMPDYSSL